MSFQPIQLMGPYPKCSAGLPPQACHGTLLPLILVSGSQEYMQWQCSVCGRRIEYKSY